MRRRFSFRNLIARIAVFLALGVIANVAVAWILARPQQNLPRHIPSAVLPVDSQRLAQAGWAVEQLVGTDYSTSGLKQRDALCYRHDSQLGQMVFQHVLTDLSTGWPLHSMTGSLIVHSDKSIQRRGLWQMSAASARGQPIELPLKPMWFGFVGNAVIYGGALWLVLFAAGALRRRRRVQRKLCPECGYPVGTSAVCTECGAALPGR